MIPCQKRGIKAKWFICLGISSVFLAPVFTCLCTTTTQIEKFESRGSRAGHALKRFDIKNFPVFDRECVIDFDMEHGVEYDGWKIIERD
jgi:hypothetical protein